MLDQFDSFYSFRYQERPISKMDKKSLFLNNLFICLHKTILHINFVNAVNLMFKI